MDYQKTLELLQQGSSSQKKRKKWLDKEKKRLLEIKTKKKKSALKETPELTTCIENQLRWCAKIRNGIENSRRTFLVRQSVARYFQKELLIYFEETETSLDFFNAWLTKYEQIIKQKNWKTEEAENKAILKLCHDFKKQKKKMVVALQKITDRKKKASLTFLILLLNVIILLFQETSFVAFDPEVFDSKNRYNPLNPFFPLNFQIKE